MIEPFGDTKSATMEHIVLIKVKADLREAEIDERLQTAAALLSQIPGVISVVAGTSIVKNNVGFQHGISVRLQSEHMLKLYKEHSIQRQVSKEQLSGLLGGSTNAERKQNMMVLDIVGKRYEKSKAKNKDSNAATSSGGITTMLLSLTTVGMACAVGALLYRKK